jgi:hypothetical protein
MEQGVNRVAWTMGFVAITAGLNGCMSVPEMAEPQVIALSVMPQTAHCDAFQHGNVVGSYDPVQGSVTVPRNEGGVQIFCIAPGYKDVRVSLQPENGFSILLSDFGPVDVAGYPSPVQIVMQPESQPGQPV